MINNGSVDNCDDKNPCTLSSQVVLQLSPFSNALASTCTTDCPKTANRKLPSYASVIESKTTIHGNIPVSEPSSAHRENISLCCSFPLEIVQGSLTSGPQPPYNLNAENKFKRRTRKLLCLYCDRSFVSVNLRQKHIERVHIIKLTRRVSARRQNQLSTMTCMHCNKQNFSKHTLNELFKHFVEEHPFKYFGCLPCEERFLVLADLVDHNTSKHLTENEEKPQSDAQTLIEEIKVNIPTNVDKVADKLTRSKFRNKSEKSLNCVVTTKIKNIKKTKLEVFRNKKISLKTSQIALKRSKRLQAQIKESKIQKICRDKKRTNNFDASNNSKQPKQSKDICINPYPEFDHFYRVKKITDHSIDNIKISSLTFNDVFDKAFFNRTKSNIEENLLHHIDGKLFKNEQSESRISSFEKILTTSQDIPSSAIESYGYGDLCLNAVTPALSLSLYSHFGEDFNSHIEYGSKPTKKRIQTKSDEVHYKYFTRRKYQASILQQKENRDLSKLDMWTQMVIKERQEKIITKKKTAKEIQEYILGEDYKNKTKMEELNRILDKRGPFEDLKEEASKKAAFDKFHLSFESDINQEVFNDVREILNEILTTVFKTIKNDDYISEITNKEIDVREIPTYLDLRRRNSLTQEEMDKSDRIALICSSQETEDYELPTNALKGKHELVELTGEWARSRMYICAACGRKFSNIKCLLEHRSIYHQHVWAQHYEFVGNQSELYRHLSIPCLGKVGVVETTIPYKHWKRSKAKVCTKCKKLCNSLNELHRHILECGGDWTWMLARKKCKYKPFGAKSRRKRRGLVLPIASKKKTEPSEKKNPKKPPEYSRQKPSDADTIERMLADLPAKRLRRSIISLRDVVFKRRKSKPSNQSSKVGHGKNKHKQQKNELIKCTTNQQRSCRSLRSLNKVLSSKIIDNNSSLMIKRNIKATQSKSSKAYQNMTKSRYIKDTNSGDSAVQSSQKHKSKKNTTKSVSHVKKSLSKIKLGTQSTKNIKKGGDLKGLVHTSSLRRRRLLNNKEKSDSFKNKQLGIEMVRENLSRTFSKEGGRQKVKKSNFTNKLDKDCSKAITSYKCQDADLTKEHKIRRGFCNNINQSKINALDERICNTNVSINTYLKNPEQNAFLDETIALKEIKSIPVRTINAPKNKDATMLINENSNGMFKSTAEHSSNIDKATKENPFILPIDDQVAPVIIETNSNPTCVTMVSHNLKGKIKKPNRGLNDCIAMLTNKLQQKDETLSSSSTEKNENQQLLEASSFPTKQLKRECILKIPTFIATKSPLLQIESALDLSKKSISSNFLISNDIEFVESTINKVIKGVIEHKCKEVLIEKLLTKKCTSVDDIIQQVVLNRTSGILSSSSCKKGKFNVRTHVDDTIDYVVNGNSDANGSSVWIKGKHKFNEEKTKPTISNRKKIYSDDRLIRNIILGKDKLLIAPFNCSHNALGNSLFTKIKENESYVSTKLATTVQKCPERTDNLETFLGNIDSEVNKLQEQDIPFVSKEKFCNENIGLRENKHKIYTVSSSDSLSLNTFNKPSNSETGSGKSDIQKIWCNNSNENCSSMNQHESNLNKDDIGNNSDSVTLLFKSFNQDDKEITQKQGYNALKNSSIVDTKPVKEIIKFLPSDSEDEIPLALISKLKKNDCSNLNLKEVASELKFKINTESYDLKNVSASKCIKPSDAESSLINTEKIKITNENKNLISTSPTKNVEAITPDSLKENTKQAVKINTFLKKKKNRPKLMGPIKKRRNSILFELKKALDTKKRRVSSSNNLIKTIKSKHVSLDYCVNHKAFLDPSEIVNGSQITEDNFKLIVNKKKQFIPSQESTMLNNPKKQCRDPHKNTNLPGTINDLMNTQRTRRKSKSSKKNDKFDNDLFKDFSLVINKKTKRIPPTSIVDDSVCDKALEKNVNVVDNFVDICTTDIVQKNPVFIDAVDEMDMEIEDIPINTNIIERNYGHFEILKSNEKTNKLVNNITQNSCIVNTMEAHNDTTRNSTKNEKKEQIFNFTRFGEEQIVNTEIGCTTKNTLQNKVTNKPNAKNVKKVMIDKNKPCSNQKSSIYEGQKTCNTLESQNIDQIVCISPDNNLDSLRLEKMSKVEDRVIIVNLNNKNMLKDTLKRLPRRVKNHKMVFNKSHTSTFQHDTLFSKASIIKEDKEPLFQNSKSNSRLLNKQVFKRSTIKKAKGLKHNANIAKSSKDSYCKIKTISPSNDTLSSSLPVVNDNKNVQIQILNSINEKIKPIKNSYDTVIFKNKRHPILISKDNLTETHKLHNNIKPVIIEPVKNTNKILNKATFAKCIPLLKDPEDKLSIKNNFIRNISQSTIKNISNSSRKKTKSTKKEVQTYENTIQVCKNNKDMLNNHQTSSDSYNTVLPKVLRLENNALSPNTNETVILTKRTNVRNQNLAEVLVQEQKFKPGKSKIKNDIFITKRNNLLKYSWYRRRKRLLMNRKKTFKKKTNLSTYKSNLAPKSDLLFSTKTFTPATSENIYSKSTKDWKDPINEIKNKNEFKKNTTVCDQNKLFHLSKTSATDHSISKNININKICESSTLDLNKVVITTNFFFSKILESNKSDELPVENKCDAESIKGSLKDSDKGPIGTRSKQKTKQLKAFDTVKYPLNIGGFKKNQLIKKRSRTVKLNRASIGLKTFKSNSQHTFSNLDKKDQKLKSALLTTKNHDELLKLTERESKWPTKSVFKGASKLAKCNNKVVINKLNLSLPDNVTLLGKMSCTKLDIKHDFLQNHQIVDEQEQRNLSKCIAEFSVDDKDSKVNVEKQSLLTSKVSSKTNHNPNKIFVEPLIVKNKGSVISINDVSSKVNLLENHNRWNLNALEPFKNDSSFFCIRRSSRQKSTLKSIGKVNNKGTNLQNNSRTSFDGKLDKKYIESSNDNIELISKCGTKLLGLILEKLPKDDNTKVVNKNSFLENNRATDVDTLNISNNKRPRQKINYNKEILDKQEIRATKYLKNIKENKSSETPTIKLTCNKNPFKKEIQAINKCDNYFNIKDISHNVIAVKNEQNIEAMETKRTNDNCTEKNIYKYTSVLPLEKAKDFVSSDITNNMAKKYNTLCDKIKIDSKNCFNFIIKPILAGQKKADGFKIPNLIIDLGKPYKEYSEIGNSINFFQESKKETPKNQLDTKTTTFLNAFDFDYKKNETNELANGCVDTGDLSERPATTTILKKKKIRYKKKLNRNDHCNKNWLSDKPCESEKLLTSISFEISNEGYIEPRIVKENNYFQGAEKSIKKNNNQNPKTVEKLESNNKQTKKFKNEENLENLFKENNDVLEFTTPVVTKHNQQQKYEKHLPDHVSLKDTEVSSCDKLQNVENFPESIISHTSDLNCLYSSEANNIHELTSGIEKNGGDTVLKGKTVKKRFSQQAFRTKKTAKNKMDIDIANILSANVRCLRTKKLGNILLSDQKKIKSYCAFSDTNKLQSSELAALLPISLKNKTQSILRTVRSKRKEKKQNVKLSSSSLCLKEKNKSVSILRTRKSNQKKKTNRNNNPYKTLTLGQNDFKNRPILVNCSGKSSWIILDTNTNEQFNPSILDLKEHLKSNSTYLTQISNKLFKKTLPQNKSCVHLSKPKKTVGTNLSFTSLKNALGTIPCPDIANRQNKGMFSDIKPLTDIITNSEMDIAPILYEIDKSPESEDICSFNKEFQQKLTCDDQLRKQCEHKLESGQKLLPDNTELNDKSLGIQSFAVDMQSNELPIVSNLLKESEVMENGNLSKDNEAQVCDILCFDTNSTVSVNDSNIFQGEDLSNSPTMAFTQRKPCLFNKNNNLHGQNKAFVCKNQSEELGTLNSLFKGKALLPKNTGPVESKQNVNKHIYLFHTLKFENQFDNLTDGRELRRSRRCCQKIASYNENDLINPLFNALENIKKRPIRKEKIGEKLLIKKDTAKSMYCEKPKTDSKDFFTLPKRLMHDYKNINTPFNSFFKKLNKPSSNTDFHYVIDKKIENIDKPSLVLSDTVTGKDIDKIYEFTEDSFENTKKEFSNRKKKVKTNKKSLVVESKISIVNNNSTENNRFGLHGPIHNDKKRKKSNYCKICNKSFIRMENLIKHRTTLTHISKLSEMEAKEAELKAQLKHKTPAKIGHTLRQSKDTQIDFPKISLSTTNRQSLNLADIISEVVNNPELDNHDSKTHFSELSNWNISKLGRNKSLGERKSFESENKLLQLKTPLSSFYSTSAASKTTVLENQINLLENLIGNKLESSPFKTNNSASNSSTKMFSCLNNSSISALGNNSGSLNKYLLDKNLNNIQSTDPIKNDFIKSSKYEEMLEDAVSAKTHEDVVLRKELNRDEALFLECCSLLKSGSEVSNSNYSNKIQNHSSFEQCANPKQYDKKLCQTIEQAHAYSDNLRTPTPLGDTYDDEASNSNTISSNWNLKSEKPLNNNQSFSFKEVINKEEVDTFFGQILKDGQQNQYEFTSKLENRSEVNDNCSAEKNSTKGTKKVFDGLKVSIPTDDLNLELLNKVQEIKILNSKNSFYNKSQTMMQTKARSTRKSKPVKKIHLGNSLFFKVNKKKNSQRGKNKKPHEYTFRANTKVLTSHDVALFNKKKQTFDNNESISYGDSIKPNTKLITSDSAMSGKRTDNTGNITKKKYKIMGKIFKNAAKSKNIDFSKQLEDIPEIPQIDNFELVENYVRNCQRVQSQYLLPPPELLQEIPKKPKMSEEEMDLLFDQLLGKKSDELKSVDNLLLPKSKAENKVRAVKKRNNKIKSRKRFRLDLESSGDEFNINQTEKNRKSKKYQDNSGINLELELRECVGVASRKSQRKCTSGKQNVLVEYWSSDEEVFDKMLNSQKDHLKRGYERNKGKQVIYEQTKPTSYKITENPKEITVKSKCNKQSQSFKTLDATDITDYGINNTSTVLIRRKRAAANPLYHWSSSSEDESQTLIEVKPIREEDDEEDRPVQHGWIVGDSPKKLVTMLALTKGKKNDFKSVKRQVKRRTNTVS